MVGQQHLCHVQMPLLGSQMEGSYGLLISWIHIGSGLYQHLDYFLVSVVRSTVNGSP